LTASKLAPTVRFPHFDFSLNMVYGFEAIRDLPTGVHMGATTKLTYDDYEKLPEREGIIYELDEGELLMEPSPALRHNLIRQRIAMELTQFIRHHHLGAVVEETDFRLGLDTVRNPDVAFITQIILRISIQISRQWKVLQPWRSKLFPRAISLKIRLRRCVNIWLRVAVLFG
jgi:Putative restriction endonuclease